MIQRRKSIAHIDNAFWQNQTKHIQKRNRNKNQNQSILKCIGAYRCGQSISEGRTPLPQPPRDLHHYPSRIHTPARQQSYHMLHAHRTQVTHHIRHPVVYELVYEFAFSNPAPAVYYYEFGFGTIEPLVGE